MRKDIYLGNTVARMRILKRK